MSKTLLEKHENLVIEIGAIYLDNMELELGKKYKNHKHQLNPGLTDEQYTKLKGKYGLSSNEFAELYNAFRNMKPTEHLQKVLDAFAASGGGVDIEPAYDESTQKLKVDVIFVIKENKLDRIEGLTPIEDIFMKMNAMLQVETVLSGSDPDAAPAF